MADRAEKIRKFHYSRKEVSDLIAAHQAKIKSVIKTSILIGLVGGCILSYVVGLIGVIIYLETI